MSAENVMNLLSGALNYQNVLGGQEATAQKMQSQQAQDEIENFYRQQAALKGQRELELKEKKVEHTSDYVADGKVMRDYYDAQGKLVNREVIGEARKDGQAMKLVKMPDGSVRSIDPQTVGELPAGTTLLGSGGGEGERGKLTEAQKFAQDTKLAGIDQMFSTGLDAAGNELDPMAMGGYAELYNANHPTSQWKMIPGTEIGWNKDPKWVKLPKTTEEIMKLGPKTVVDRDDKTGEEITVAKIVKFANEKKTTPEAVLKYLGLVR